MKVVHSVAVLCCLVLSTWAGKKRITDGNFEIIYDDQIPKMRKDSFYLDVNKGLPVYRADFGIYRPYTNVGWSAGSYRMFHVDNAGGTSDLSEAVSYEILLKLVGAQLHQTEEEVQYRPIKSKKTDYVAQIPMSSVFPKLVSVSVTRAVGRNKNVGFTTAPVDLCEKLLTRKLEGLEKADENSYDKWDMNVLHVFAWDDATVNNCIVAMNNIRATLGIRAYRDMVVILSLASQTSSQTLPAEQAKLVFDNAANKPGLYTTQSTGSFINSGSGRHIPNSGNAGDIFNNRWGIGQSLKLN